jgi:glycosyltransferase involved in cell wall biosynthesis
MRANLEMCFYPCQNLLMNRFRGLRARHRRLRKVRWCRLSLLEILPVTEKVGPICPEGNMFLNLDVVVPTYNRSQLLRRALTSLLTAPIPAGLSVVILVVDNNSTDDTARVVREFPCPPDRSVVYIREPKQGLSHARNAGINAGSGGLIGFIDDDEEIGQYWYEVVAREFSDASVDFIGGPYLGNWAAPPPAWLPPGYNSVIGVTPLKPRGHFGSGLSGMLMGGNAVVRRTVFDRIGTYSTRLGRSGKGLLSEEDAEFYRRLDVASIPGIYVPDLIIHHYIPTERLTRNYHRRWSFWRAVSQGVLDRDRKELSVYVLGIPRHRIGRALRGVVAYPGHCLSPTAQGQAFADELATWDLLGFIYGKHFVRIEGFYAGQK